MDNRRDKIGDSVGEVCGADKTWVILATGPSLRAEDAEKVIGRCRVAAVSNAYLLAPRADILVSNDRKWWEHNPSAFDFKGRKFCSHELRGVEQFREHVHLGRNSGLMAMCVARKLGAKKLILLGFDMHGEHFFGKHPEPLKNATEKIFKTHIGQFNGFSGCDVVNCTPDSALLRFRFSTLEEELPHGG